MQLKKKGRGKEEGSWGAGQDGEEAEEEEVLGTTSL